MIALVAAAWACTPTCSCEWALQTFPGDGATIPAMPTVYVTGYDPPGGGPFFASPPLISLHGAGGERVPVDVTRIALDVYAVRPRAQIDGTVQLVVWGDADSSRDPTVGVRFVVGPMPPKPRRPRVRAVHRVDVSYGAACGCNGYAYVEITLSQVAEGSTVGVWADDGSGFDYSAPPRDIVEVAGGRVVVGTGPCWDAHVPLWGADDSYSGSAHRLGLRVLDPAGRASPPVKVEVPAWKATRASNR